MKTGYAEININSELGIGISGYYVPRFAKGFLDNIMAQCLAISTGGTPVLIISVDNCLIFTEIADRYRGAIAQKTGVPAQNIFLSATHTHTAPLLRNGDFFEADEQAIEKYSEFLKDQLCKVAGSALENMLDTRMGYAVTTAPDRIAYIRRYRMKDGTTMTCPPINDPDIAFPIGELDQRVNILRFDREGEGSVVILNYGIHADTVGGDMISADWIAWTRATVEKALDGTKCIYINGAQGDVGSTHINPTPSDMNDTEISFDNEMKSAGHSRFVGRALAGAILQVYDKVEYTPVDEVKILHKTVSVTANLPKQSDLPRAYEYKKLHDEGREDLIPYEAMELTTVVAEALRMCRLDGGPKKFDLNLTGLKLGPVALVGLPGEPFTDIGVRIKQNGGWGLIMPCGLINGYEGYFPTKEAFLEGGYEARSSQYCADVTDKLISGAGELLKEMLK